MILKNRAVQKMGLVIMLLILAGCAGVSSAPTTIPSPSVVLTDSPKSGYINGRVHLVSPPTPPMIVYVVDQATGLWAFTETKAIDGDAPFALSVPPGTYKVFAFSENSAFAGYTLDEWSLADVNVLEGQTVSEIIVRPPSQSECGALFGVPASPDGRFAAVPGPTEDCKARVLTPSNGPIASSHPQRIEFAPGAMSGQVQGSLTKEGALNQYLFSAMAGQEMTVRLITGGDPAVSGIFFVIWGNDGTILVSEQDKATSWTGNLPSTQDYYIDVSSVAKAPVDYTLEIIISAIKSEVLPLDVPIGFEFLFGLNGTFMLPPNFPVAENLPAVQPYVITAENNDYDISLDFGPECRGAGACHYGSLSGKKVVSNQPESTPNFTFEPDRAQKVTLAKNIEGYFIEGLCGASCDDSKVFWIYNGYQYMIGLKGGTQKDVVDLANAAILNSLN